MGAIDKIIEMIIDDDDLQDGIKAISIVDRPAIEMDFITLSKEDVKLKKVNSEKRILMGPALIPNKAIYRVDEEGDEYYIYFSEETIRKTSERFLKNGYQTNASLQHDVAIDGTSIVESWIVEDPQKDKSAMYFKDIKPGTWMVSMKIYDDDLWEDFIETGIVKGFSIEGAFDARQSLSKDDLLLEQIVSILEDEKYLDVDTESGILATIDEIEGELIEDIEKEYTLISEEFVKNEDEEFDIEHHLNTYITNLSSIQNSDVDSPRYKVRYKYENTTRPTNQPKTSKSRPLCRRLMSKSNSGVVYRKEDWQNMSSKGGAEANNQSYSVWKYKGGVNCRHGIVRMIYMKSLNDEGNVMGGNPMQNVTLVNDALQAAIDDGANIDIIEDTRVATAPRDTRTKGHKR